VTTFVGTVQFACTVDGVAVGVGVGVGVAVGVEVGVAVGVDVGVGVGDPEALMPMSVPSDAALTPGEPPARRKPA